MKAALYARVSTTDKDQDPETQLVPLRDFARAQGWEAVEYVDHASAADLARRTAWRRLLEDAARRKVDIILLRAWGVGLRSYSEPWLDTTSPFGEALYYITVAYAQLERAIIAERVKAGMERARREGKRLGRPPAGIDPRAWERTVREIEAGRTGRFQVMRLHHLPAPARPILAWPRRSGKGRRGLRHMLPRCAWSAIPRPRLSLRSPSASAPCGHQGRLRRPPPPWPPGPRPGQGAHKTRKGVRCGEAVEAGGLAVRDLRAPGVAAVPGAGPVGSGTARPGGGARPRDTHDEGDATMRWQHARYISSVRGAEAAEALGVYETWPRCQRCGTRITRLPTLTCGRCGRRIGWCCWGDPGKPGRPETKRCVECVETGA